MYKNEEGYADPTVGEAMSVLMRDFKEATKRKYRIKHRPKVYVVSRFAGDISGNYKKAIGFCKYVISKCRIPVASHIMYPPLLDDANPAERELGILFGLSLLAVCDEVWVFSGKDKFLSKGMEQEVAEAKALKKPIRYFNEEDVLCK